MERKSIWVFQQVFIELLKLKSYSQNFGGELMRNTASMGFSVKLHVLISLTLFTNISSIFHTKVNGIQRNFEN